MIVASELLSRCHDFAAMNHDDPTSPDSLIGFFQQFRPDGGGFEGLFDELPGGEQVHQRLQDLYELAGDDRRGNGQRDVYFLIRRPPTVDAVDVQGWASEWLTGIQQISEKVSNGVLSSVMEPLPEIRVLEGKAPKNPKDEINQSELFKAFTSEVPGLTARLDKDDEINACLRPAFYFISCDAMLRDHLMWPLIANKTDQLGPGLMDPFLPYFKLWTHGIKYRIIRPDTIDFYIPRVDQNASMIPE
ncbi:MAG: apolipoprotein acyltransferase [Planctomycetota bacterium]